MPQRTPLTRLVPAADVSRVASALPPPEVGLRRRSPADALRVRGYVTPTADLAGRNCPRRPGALTICGSLLLRLAYRVLYDLRSRWHVGGIWSGSLMAS
jgi:hypothetical protein